MFERINLVPQLALAGRIKKIVPLVCCVLFLIGCAYVFLAGRQLDGKNLKLKNEVALLERQQEDQQNLQTAIVQLNGKVEELKEQEKVLYKVVANLSEIPKKKRHHSELLTGISSLLPSTVRCEKIVINERDGQISGKAIVYRDLPSFVQGLSALPRFHSVMLQVVHQTEEQDDDLLTFNIVFGIR